MIQGCFNMNLFIGDYNTFYKFIDGYARNKTLSLTRKHKSGVCACCGTSNSEIQFAHKRGCERVDLVRKFFNLSTLKEEDGTYTVDLDKFEHLFIDFTSDISNFHFLCGKCHTKYDKAEISEKEFKHKSESVKALRSRKKSQI